MSVKHRKRIWRTVAAVALVIAVIIIRQTIAAGMNNAALGKPVDVASYLGGLIAAVLLVCVAVFAGIMATLHI